MHCDSRVYIETVGITSMAGLKQRSLTAAIAIPVTLAIVIFGDIAYVLVAGLLVVIGGWEIAAMAFVRPSDNPMWKALVPISGLAIAGGLAFPHMVNSFALFAAVWLLLSLLALGAATADLKGVGISLAVTLAAGWYLGVGVGHLVLLRAPELKSLFSEASGYQPILWLLAIVWTTDTAAYLVGRAFGRRSLAPTISPNKTVEGALAGLLFGGLVAALVGPVIGYPPLVALAGGLIVSLFAQAGDLFESLIKRLAGVKDSGVLFPGHGGVLDRIDSLLFAAPALYYFLRLTGSVTA